MESNYLAEALLFLFCLIFIVLEKSKFIKIYELKYDQKMKILNAPNEVQWLLDQPDPCEKLDLINLDFVLLSPQNLKLLGKLKKCFKNEENFMKALDSVFTVKAEDLLINYFIPMARHNFPHLIPRIFYECAFNSNYRCIKSLIKSDSFINYKGQNILHLAAKLDDLHLAKFVTLKTEPFLHLRDIYNQIPAVYIQSKELLTFFIERCSLESNNSPFKLEIKAAIEHARLRLSENQDQSHLMRLFGSPSYDNFINQIYVEVKRNSILNDSYETINRITSWYNPNVQFKFYIRFNGEYGIDRNGLTLEWLSLLLDSFFIPSEINNNLPLFEPVSDDSNLYAPTNYHQPAVYKFAGSIIAEAIKRRLAIKVEFIPSLYRKIYKIEPFRIDDMEIQCPQVYKNILLLLEQTEEAEFARKSLDLSPSKAPKFIKKYVANNLYGKYRISLNAFVTGIHARLPIDLTSHYNPNELKLFMKGEENQISFKDLKNIIRFSTENPEKQGELLRVLESFSSDQLMKFFKFATGRNSVPYGGLSCLPSPINVQFIRFNSIKALPIASTCSSTITIPNSLTEKQLEHALIYSIENCDTFELA